MDLYLLIEDLRKLLASCLIYGAAFHIWSTLALLQFDSADDTTQEPSLDGRTSRTNEKDTNNKDHAEELDEDDSLFIPLSWPFLQPGKFYAKSDPEWQEFGKIHQDSKKIQSLQGTMGPKLILESRIPMLTCLDELAFIVKDNTLRSRRLSTLLGSPVELAIAWTGVQFPYRAPPQYCRLGYVSLHLSLCHFTDKWAVWRSMALEHRLSLSRWIMMRVVAFVVVYNLSL